VALKFVIDVHFLQEEAVGHFDGIESCAMEKGVFQIEGIGEAVGRIDAHNEGLLAVFGQMHAGGSRYAGFADAALAAKKENSHIRLDAAAYFQPYTFSHLVQQTR
jgi:hypothetical protein